jgi:predicted metal-dependent hydrolase
MRAREILPERVEYFSAIMGVKPTHVSINEAKTRFGSCSEKRRINFSCRVMRYPSEAIDYVVVHELAHLKFLNHSREFWAFVESILPDYKARKGLLK